MQIVRSGKLSQFSQIYFQSRKFSSENFLSYYKVFLGLKMADSGPGSGPGLLRYFKPCRKDSCQIPLPNPTGLLCEKLDSAAIEEANKEVTAVIADTGGKRKLYLKLTDEQWATIGRYAAEHGTVNAIRRFARDFPKDSWITWLIFTFKSLAKDGCPIILIDMETSNAAILFKFCHCYVYSSCQRDNTCFTL